MVSSILLVMIHENRSNYRERRRTKRIINLIAKKRWILTALLKGEKKVELLLMEKHKNEIWIKPGHHEANIYTLREIRFLNLSFSTTHGNTMEYMGKARAERKI